MNKTGFHTNKGVEMTEEQEKKVNEAESADVENVEADAIEHKQEPEEELKKEPTGTDKETKEIVEDEPSELDARLTLGQKLFFLLVILFTAFLIFLKFFWEPKQRDTRNDPPPGIEQSFEFPENNGNFPDPYAPLGEGN